MADSGQIPNCGSFGAELVNSSSVRCTKRCRVEGSLGHLTEPMFHEAYPTLSSYIEHMNRYSSLGAALAAQKGQTSFTLLNILLRPLGTFIYNYVIRGGFLDGREGLLLHLYHASYVSWKYAKSWELARQREVKVNS